MALYHTQNQYVYTFYAFYTFYTFYALFSISRKYIYDCCYSNTQSKIFYKT